MAVTDEPKVRPSEKMNLNPEPLKIVRTAYETKCGKCGRRWGMRGTCVCLDPIVVDIKIEELDVPRPSQGEA